MKFSLFVHMERIEPSATHAELYEGYLSLCRMADEGGMYAIWTGEHHCMDFTIAPNPFLSVVDLARRTRNVRLGTATIVAPFWHPIKLAGEAAMTDLLCEGRLELGLARGAYRYEYERLMPGMDGEEAGRRLREVAPTLRRLWAGNYAHEGAFHRFPATTSSPKPVQPGGPPIWIAARDPDSHRFAVEEGFDVQVTPLWQGDEEVERLAQRFREAYGRTAPARKPRIMLLQHAYVASTGEEADEGARLLGRFYCYFAHWFANERPVSQGLLAPLGEAEIAAMPQFAPAVLRRNLPIGTPKEVADRLKRYRDLGFDEYALWIDSSMDPARKRASLGRFIDEVIPRVS